MQLHPDTIAFLSRITGSAVILPAAIAAINEFVTWCYANGLRDTAGQNHIVESCWIASTTVLTKLWFRSGESAGLTLLGTPSYNNTTGVTVTAGTNELRTHNANLLNINDFSIFFHNLSTAANRDFFGVSDATNTPRLLIHPRWNGDDNLYFDVGNPSTGRISVANSANSSGLIVGTKSNATQTIYQRGVQIAQSTTASTSGLSFPAAAIAAMGRNAADVVTARNIGGFGTGKSIPSAAIAGFTTRWNAIQTALGR
jgi:hypothetical protein